MLHNTRCVSVVDNINETRLTLLSTHNAAQCIIEFHSPIERVIVTSASSSITICN